MKFNFLKTAIPLAVAASTLIPSAATAQSQEKPSKKITNEVLYEGKIPEFYVWYQKNSEETPGVRHTMRQLVETEERIDGRETGVKMKKFPTQVLPVDIQDVYKVWLGDINGTPLTELGFDVYAFNDDNGGFRDAEADSAYIANVLHGEGQIRYAVEKHDGPRIDSVLGTIRINSVDGSPAYVRGLESDNEQLANNLLSGKNGQGRTEPSAEELIQKIKDKNKPHAHKPKGHKHEESGPKVYVELGNEFGDLEGMYVGAGVNPVKELGIGVRAGFIEGMLEQLAVNERKEFADTYHIRKETVNHDLDAMAISGVITVRPTSRIGMYGIFGRVQGDDNQTGERFLGVYYSDTGELVADDENPRREDLPATTKDLSATVYGGGLEIRLFKHLSATADIQRMNFEDSRVDDVTQYGLGLRGSF